MENKKEVMLFTDLYNLEGVQGQQDIDFVNIKIDKDTKLFLDPSLIQGQSTGSSELQAWMKNSHECINSFFECLFAAYRNDDETRLLNLLSYAHEPHETNLGLSSNSPKGKGNTELGLLNIFKNIKTLLEEELIENVMDTCVFIEKFAEDGMSDLVTNILRKHLYEFTMDQCAKFNIEVSNEDSEIGYYWDGLDQEWKMLIGKKLVNEHKKDSILLVPKTIVQSSYTYSIGEFFQKKILSELQEQELRNRSNLCKETISKKGVRKIFPPAKTLVCKEIVGDTPHKEFATEYTLNNKKLIADFRIDMEKENEEGKHILSDERLTEYISK